MLSMLLLIDEQLSRSMYFLTSRSISGESNEVDSTGSVSVKLIDVPPTMANGLLCDSDFASGMTAAICSIG